MRALIVIAFAMMALANPMIDSHLKSLIQTGYTVDTVVQLLIAMDRVTGDHLEALINTWSETSANFETRIAGLQDLDSQQHQHCAVITGTIDEIHREIERYSQFISEAQDHINVNVATIQDRLAKRCVSNLMFVEKLKSNQDSTRLLTFLKAKVSDPGFADYLEGTAGALVELRHAIKSNSNVLSLIAKHHMFAQISQAYTGEDDLHYDTQARTDEQIGHGHEDNAVDALHVDSFTIDARNLDNFIAELLGFIDGLLDQLHHENIQLQANEFTAVENLIEYQDQVQHENAVLGVYIAQWSQHVDDLKELLVQDEQAQEECQARADDLDQAVQDAQDQYADATSQFNERKSSLEGTLSALETIIRIYVDKVLGASEVYKQRIDDQLARSRPEGQVADYDQLTFNSGNQDQPSYVEEEVVSGGAHDVRNDQNSYTVPSFDDKSAEARHAAYQQNEDWNQEISEFVSVVSSIVGSEN